MKILPNTWIVFLGILLMASALVVEGKSARSLNPFDRISQVELDIFVGETVGSTKKDSLFSGSPDAQELFEKTVTKDLEIALRKVRIEPVHGAEDFLGVGVWGHQEVSSDGKISHVFFIEVTVIDVGFSSDSTCEEDQDLTLRSRAIGVASREMIVEVLRAESLRLVEELLSSRDVQNSPSSF